MEALQGQLQSQLQAAGKRMIAGGLTWGNAGNLSVRLPEGRFLVTASGTQLDRLGEEDFVVCELNGRVVGAGKPSKEVPMHRAVYEAREDIGAVLHGAPFYSTLAACTDLEPRADLFVEAMYYLERIARVPYHHPGSDMLGEAVREQAGKANVLLLENHGVLVYDVTVAEALQAMQVLELTCRMMLEARGAKLTLRPVPDETMRAFLETAAYKPRREWSS